jgi:hypothetical protein
MGFMKTGEAGNTSMLGNEDEEEQERARKEKVRWKHMKDEE